MPTVAGRGVKLHLLGGPAKLISALRLCGQHTLQDCVALDGGLFDLTGAGVAFDLDPHAPTGTYVVEAAVETGPCQRTVARWAQFTVAPPPSERMVLTVDMTPAEGTCVDAAATRQDRRDHRLGDDERTTATGSGDVRHECAADGVYTVTIGGRGCRPRRLEHIRRSNFVELWLSVCQRLFGGGHVGRWRSCSAISRAGCSPRCCASLGCLGLPRTGVGQGPLLRVLCGHRRGGLR